MRGLCEAMINQANSWVYYIYGAVVSFIQVGASAAKCVVRVVAVGAPRNQSIVRRKLMAAAVIKC